MARLTEKEEDLLDKLREALANHLLSEDEVKELRQGLELKRSLGILGLAVIKLAALITAGTLLLQSYFSMRGNP